jgi:hypothetical protein
MLAEIRNNLQKLNTQLGESRAILNTAGELLTKNVENYSGAEVRQVKKVDSMKAHNRDFYKNPVVVASVGGAAGGATVGAVAGAASAGAATPAGSTTTVNYTDNSVNNNYTSPEMSEAATIPDTTAGVASSASDVYAQNSATPVSIAPTQSPSVTPQPAAANPTQPAPGGPAAAGSGMSTAAKVATGAGAAGAVAAGGIFGGREIKKHKDAKEVSAEKTGASVEEEYDPEAELEKALKRVRELSDEE